MSQDLITIGRVHGQRKESPSHAMTPFKPWPHHDYTLSIKYGLFIIDQDKDFILPSYRTLRIANYESLHCFPVLLINDELIENEESFRIVIYDILLYFPTLKLLDRPDDLFTSAVTEVFILQDYNDGNVIERLSK